MTPRYHPGALLQNDTEAALCVVPDVALTMEPIEAETANGKVLGLRSTARGQLELHSTHARWSPSSSTSSPSLHIALSSIQQFSSCAGGEFREWRLMIHAGVGSDGCVYTFEPVGRAEAEQIAAMLSEATGIRAREARKFAEGVREHRLALVRLRLWRELNAQGEGVWIEDMDRLRETIRRLSGGAREATAQAAPNAEPAASSERDMELLFHSCARNEDVAKETLATLRRLWGVVNGAESTRPRIVAIAGRLVDRAFAAHRPKCATLLAAWLVEAERSLNPSKDSRLLEEIYELRKRAEEIRRQPVGSGHSNV
eukprot:m51a1_g3496 hypothetical protein (313) ;mRNA; r:814805-815801